VTDSLKATTSWLTEAEKSAIADQAIELLANVGMRFTGSRTLPLLAARGARIDETTGVVRLPRDLVEWAAATAPRSVLLGGAAAADDVLLGEGERFHFCPSGCVAKTLDFRTGIRRPSTLDDVRSGTALLDEMSELDVMVTQVTATDVPLEQRELVEYHAILTETTKHVTFIDCPHEVDAVLRILDVLAGDLERFRARPRISTVVTAASPLQVDGAALDVHVALAGRGAPVFVYSMAIAGATAPVTLAGTVAQGVAEFLGIATALQVAAPGAGLVFCFGSGVLDMLRTTFSLGCLESGLMAVAATEVGHYLGVPTLNPGLSTDAKYAGIQAGYEKALKALTVCGAGPDLVSGWGVIDSHNTMSMTQIVIDNEIAAMVRRLLGQVEVSDRTLAADSIAQVGPGGDFLGQKETARRIRAGEHFMPTISDRVSYEKWAEREKTEVDAAREQVEQVLAARAQRPSYLDEAQLEALAEICLPSDGGAGRAPRAT